MRLVCPNCDAQYEVDDAVIPASGRDVQCSNCGHTWFQPGAYVPAEDTVTAPETPDVADADDDWEDTPAAAPTPAAEMDDDDTATVEDHGDDDWDDVEADDAIDVPAQEPAAPQRRGLDENIADILRQEAEFSTRAREGESLESQPDLGLEEGTAAATGGLRERVARLRGVPSEPPASSEPAKRRDLLPDIEEINSTLRATSERPDEAQFEDIYDEDAPNQRGRFSMGFGIVILMGAILFALYLFAPSIRLMVPGAQPYIDGYVMFADGLLVKVDMMVGDAMVKLTALIQNLTN
ncbi:MAG: zinc-ribbon domain-containing protein [Pseudomonadota bacterium]|nr:zinc-ribbon domain-containing protein [Pseudomonadota bacterium]